MAKYIFQSPGRYVQGEDVLNELGEEIKAFGEKPLVISDSVVWDIVKDKVEDSFKNASVSFTYEEFQGESSAKEFDRIADIIKEKDLDIVVGIGGGKTFDTAKVAADETGIPVVIVPTTASSDAPVTGMSVVYTVDGVFEGYRIFHKNPDLIVVDTNVIVNAPLNQFASGIADGLATYIEILATEKSNTNGLSGGKTTKAGHAIAKEASEILFDYGYPAYQAVSKKVVTPQVEAVIEASTLLSGIGGQNGGVSGAHAIHDGLTALSGDVHNLSHGEKVSYGILTHLVLVGADSALFNKYAALLKSIGMPTTLEDMKLGDASYEDLVKVGEVAVSDETTMANLSEKITPNDVANAMVAADQFSKNL